MRKVMNMFSFFCYMGWHWTWAYWGTKPQSKLMCDRMRRARRSHASSEPKSESMLSSPDYKYYVLTKSIDGLFQILCILCTFLLKNKNKTIERLNDTWSKPTFLLKAQILSHSMFTTDLDPPWQEEVKGYFYLIQNILHGYTDTSNKRKP